MCTHAIVLSDGRCYFCGDDTFETCIYPGCNLPGRPTPRMTAYSSWDGEGEDPNGPLTLCAEHAAQHIEEMQDLWNTYYERIRF